MGEPKYFPSSCKNASIKCKKCMGNYSKVLAGAADHERLNIDSSNILTSTPVC